MQNRENRRVVRLKPRHPLKVVMGSIGGDFHYELQTRNISSNGFFLDFEKPGRFPFTSASIMEVWLQLDERTTVFFNGKMARVVYPNDEQAQDTGPGIAIRIVQIEREEEDKLRNFITEHFQEDEEAHPHQAAS